MILNMIAAGSGVEWHHGTYDNRSGLGARFNLTNLDGKPKFLLIHKDVDTAIRGVIAYAFLGNDGAYTGRSAITDDNFSTRYKNTVAEWDDTTETFTITLWNSQGMYGFEYII